MSRFTRLRMLRRDMRADAAMWSCVAGLVAVTTFVATAGPPLIGRGDDQALRRKMATASAENKSMSVTLATDSIVLARDGAPPAEFSAFAARTTADLPPDIRAMFGAPDFYVESPGASLDGPGLDKSMTAPRFTLFYSNSAAAGVRYVEGAPPGAARGAAVPVAVSASARDHVHFRLGQTFTVDTGGKAMSVKIAGIYVPVDPAASFWQLHPWAAQPHAVSAGLQTYWSGSMLASAAGIASASFDYGAATSVRVTLPFDASALTADRAAPAATALTRIGSSAETSLCSDAFQTSTDSDRQPLQCGPFVARPGSVAVVDGIPAALTGFVHARAQATVIDSFSFAALVTVALIALLAAARLLVGRRANDILLRRGRGASMRALAAAAVTQGSLAVVPAVVAGWGAALGAAKLSRPAHPAGPSSSSGTVWWLVAAVVLAGVLMPACCTWSVARGERPRTADRGVAVRRRLAVEGGLLLVAVASVAPLRGRGVSGVGASGIDPQVSLAPVLVAAVGAAVLLRVHPIPLRGLLGWARGRRSAVPVVAFAYARRDAGVGVTGLLVLVLTMGGLVFGGMIGRTVSAAQGSAASWTVAGDAMVTGHDVGGDVARQVAAVPGVRQAVAEGSTWLSSGGQQVFTVGVDVKALAAADPASRLAQAFATAGTDRAAYVTAGVVAPTAHTLAVGDAALTIVGNGDLAAADLRVVASELAGEAAGRPVAVVPLDVLQTLVPDAGADTLVVYGPTATAAALQAALPLNVTYSVQTRAGYLDALSTNALAGSMNRVAMFCGLGSALFALAALLLELLATAPERGRSVAFLRTMGLRRRSAATVLVLRLLPIAVTGAVAGAAVGLALPRVLGPALRLQDVVGGTAQPPILVDYGLVAALAAGVVGLVVAAGLLDAFVARRRGFSAALRIGGD